MPEQNTCEEALVELISDHLETLHGMTLEETVRMIKDQRHAVPVNMDGLDVIWRKRQPGFVPSKPAGKSYIVEGDRTLTEEQYRVWAEAQEAVQYDFSVHGVVMSKEEFEKWLRKSPRPNSKEEIEAWLNEEE